MRNILGLGLGLIFVGLSLASDAAVQTPRVHTLERASAAVRLEHANTRLLIYKVKDQKREILDQSWRPFLNRANFVTAPVFRRLSQLNSNQMQTLSVPAKRSLPEFSRYFVRQYPAALNKTDAIFALEEMFNDPNIEFAYFEPKMSDAVVLERMALPQSASPALTPLSDFEKMQFHLEPAPLGVNARAAWALAGGTGQGIHVIDVETGWKTTHFEFGPVFYDNGKNGQTDHGTAVWGEVAARPDGKGVTGIAYDVQWGIAGNGFASMEEYPVTIAGEIEKAALQLQPGDLMIIEQHAPLVDDYGPIEYFEPVFKALKFVTDRGIHCVAAGGNGYSNLDDPKYQGLFDPAVRDSGCVLVGAVDSPKGARARERSAFSNYGKRMDAYGYGEDVVTSGYGDLYDGFVGPQLATYTATFSGTSSATPIVAGAVASLLGMAKAKGLLITPVELRQALRETGTKQEGDQSQRVGNMPDLEALITYFKIRE